MAAKITDIANFTYYHSSDFAKIGALLLKTTKEIQDNQQYNFVEVCLLYLQH